MPSRKKSPVFVVGSPRSGTTLFYHILLSSGGFAVYLTEARAFDMLAPRFGDLSVRRNKQQLLSIWLQSEFFRRSGLEAAEFRERILANCRSAGDFLRILMESIAEAQKVTRWAECTPLNLLYMPEIKRSFPDALFIHMIRDGRDVALSLEQQGWARPFPWDKKRRVLVAGLFWEWLVGKGRESAHSVAPDYMEVRFEDLVDRPKATLARIATFVDHDLDYDHIQRVGIGSVSRPNTSFKVDSTEGGFNPVGRWKSGYSREALTRFEGLVGPFLQELGYPLTIPKEELRTDLAMAGTKALYRLRYGSRQWLKARTPLGRWFVNIDLLFDFRAHDRDRLAQT